MFSLLSSIYEELTYVPERRILVLGVENSGKTAILEQIKAAYGSKTYLRYDAVTPTVGLNVGRARSVHERLLLWDLGGAKALRPIWERYVQEADALVWVVDATDESKLQDGRETLDGLLRRKNLERSPLLVFANKQDKAGAMDPITVSLALDLLSYAELRPQCVQPSSAKTGSGVKEGMDWLIERLRNPGMDFRTSIKAVP